MILKDISVRSIWTYLTASSCRRERNTERQTDRHRQTDRQAQTDRERESEREI